MNKDSSKNPFGGSAERSSSVVEQPSSIDKVIEAFRGGKKFYHQNYNGIWEEAKDIKRDEHSSSASGERILVQTASHEEGHYSLEDLRTFLRAQKEAEEGGVEAYLALGAKIHKSAKRIEGRPEDRSPTPENIDRMVNTDYLDQIVKDAMNQIRHGSDDNYQKSGGTRDIERMAENGMGMSKGFEKYFPGWKQFHFIRLHEAIEVKREALVKEMFIVIAEQEGTTPDKLREAIEMGRKAEEKMEKISQKLRSAYAPV